MKRFLRKRLSRWRLVKDDKVHWHYELRYSFIPLKWWK